MTYNSERVLLIVLFFTAILLRLPFLEKMQSHWDGPNYTIGIIRYSLENNTPSIPGYPIYIAMGKIAYLFTNDPHRAILLVSVFLSGVGALVFYGVGKLLFNKTVGIIASALFLSAPTSYFFGVTANPYGALLTTSSLLAAIVYLIVFKKKNYGIILGITFSFVIGFRPQDMIFLLPIFVFGLLFLKNIEKYKAIIFFVLTFLVWFIPTANSVGGISNYIRYLQPFFTNDAKVQITFDRVKAIWFILLRGYYLTLGIAGTFLLFYFKKLLDIIRDKNYIIISKQRHLIIFFFLWICPSLFFNAFVRSDHAAHQMTYLSGFIFLISYAIWRTTRKHVAILFSILFLIICFNLFTFLRDRDPGYQKPYVSQSYHYSELLKNNVRLPAIISFVSRYKSDNTIILVDPEIFRPVTYYLKDYKVYAYSSLDTDILQIADTIHFGYNWDYRFTLDKTHVLSVPKGINTIICVPNNKEYAISANKVKRVVLNGNALLYSFSTGPNDRFALSIHSIKEISED